MTTDSLLERDPRPPLPPTAVLCAGMFRSGSTWAFNVVKAVLAEAGPDLPIDAGYAEGDDLVSAVLRGGPTHRVYKFHLGTPEIADVVDRGVVDAVVYSRRDPMTALASCVEQFCSREQFREYWTFDKAVEHIVDGLRLGRSLAHSDRAVEVDLHADGERASVDRIVDHLGIDVATERRVAIAASLTFDEMRERSNRIAEMSPDALLRGINDPETLMHAGHVDKGVHRDWRSELSEEQIAQASAAFLPFLG